MNFENKKIEIDSDVAISLMAVFGIVLMAIARNVIFTPEETILRFSLIILVLLATPLVIMVYPTIKTFSTEIKAIIAAVIFFVIFLSQTGVFAELKKILLDPAIAACLIAYILIAALLLKKENEIEGSTGTIYIRDYDLIKPYIMPGLNIIILAVASIWLDPNLGLSPEDATLILVAALACLAVATMALIYPTMIPLKKRGIKINNDKIKPPITTAI